MENHPIPQDVTGFKFRVIGSITIKQFGYILLAGVLCLIVFLMHINILITIPIMLLLAGLGLGFAFVPIEGRPMDKMVVNFVRALPKENQYIYHKKGVNLTEMVMFQPLKVVSAKIQQASTADQTKKRELASLLRNSSFRPDDDELAFFKNIKTTFDNPNDVIKPVLPVQNIQEKPLVTFAAVKPVSLPTAPVEPLPVVTQMPVNSPVSSPLPAIPPQETAQPVIKMPVQADVARQIVSAPTATSSIPSNTTLNQPVPQIQNSQPVSQMYQSPNLPQSPDQTAPTAIASDSNSQLNAGFPILPDKPNIVLGVVRDPRGKALQYVLVEVFDQNEIPVRAFKTNQLGQFTAATPLANGKYRVIFEDPQKKHEFETVEISLDGSSIFQPLIITSVDQREKLRRELFENSPITSP